MTKQITNHIMMVRPISFRKNEQTAVNNYYQHTEEKLSQAEVQDEALHEFDEFVQKLEVEGVRVTVFEDNEDYSTPDSIFPNNWISFHEKGVIRVYPMFAPNRRKERRKDIIEVLGDSYQLDQSLLAWEDKNQFLEATGSLVLDRPNSLVYAALSDRTMMDPLEDFCKQTGAAKVAFTANQTVGNQRLPIYHTNVMMCLGEAFVAVCLDAIDDPKERSTVESKLRDTGKEIIEILEEQVEQFAGNMLQVEGRDQARLVVMSESAFLCLGEEQRQRLEKHGKLVYSPINTIEKLGGGSARCMMAEVF